MKIEIGKFYKTRDGRKARIYAVDAGDPTPIHGAIRSPEDKWWSFVWHSGGNVSPNLPYDGDLVSEWEEPRARMKAYIWDGMVRIFPAKPSPEWTEAPWLDEPEDNKK